MGRIAGELVEIDHAVWLMRCPDPLVDRLTRSLIVSRRVGCGPTKRHDGPKNDLDTARMGAGYDLPITGDQFLRSHHWIVTEHRVARHADIVCTFQDDKVR